MATTSKSDGDSESKRVPRIKDQDPDKQDSVEVKGKTAPQEPPDTVNEQDQDLLIKRTHPARGAFLGRLVNPKERIKHGFSDQAKAFQAAALLEIVRMNPADIDSHRDLREQELVFVSLEEIAPLLNTFLFLVPLNRVQGYFLPEGQDLAEPHQVGFASS